MKSRSWSSRLAAAFLILVTSSGCASYDEYTASDACEDLGYSLSNKALECSKDTDFATSVYERFRSRFSCSAQAVDPSASLSCGSTVLNQDCAKLSTNNGADGFLVELNICGAFGTDIGSDGGCSLLANQLAALERSTNSSCSPPAPATSWSSWVADRYSCPSSNAPDKVAACARSLSCFGSNVDADRALLSSESCRGLVELKQPFEACSYFESALVEGMNRYCGNGVDAYSSDLGAYFSSRFSCDPGLSFAAVDAVCGFGSFCPRNLSDPQITTPNLEDAELSLLSSLYASGCAAALNQHECNWKYSIEQWIFRCTGLATYARDTSNAIEEKYPCATAPDPAPLVNCLPLLSCLDSGASASDWEQILVASPSTTGCTILGPSVGSGVAP